MSELVLNLTLSPQPMQFRLGYFEGGEDNHDNEL